MLKVLRFSRIKSLLLKGTGWVACAFLLFTLSVQAQESVQPEEAETSVVEAVAVEESAGETQVAEVEAVDTPVVDEIEDLKQEVINLNRDLFILEEDLLFPANTQFVVFLSVDVGHFFQLDAIELKVDGETISTYLYTDRQIKALHKGGIQRLYMGNLRSGEHELTAFITGSGPNGRDYKLGTTKKFDKGSDITSLELRVTDSTRKYQPEFTVVEWE